MDKKSKHIFWTKRNVIIAVTALVVFAAAIGGGVWYIRSNAPQPNEERTASEAEKARDAARLKQSEADDKLRQAAGKEIASKNAAAADKLYQDAIAAAATQERKAQLYIDLSAVYYGQGLYDQAFAAANKANDVNPDKYLLADWLSRLYEDRKDYPNAVKYYRLAGEWASSSQNKTGIPKATYNSEAERVSKLIKGNGQ